MNRMLMLGAVTSTTLATAVDIDPNLVEGVGRWPATIVLGSLAGMCIWFMYRQGRDFANAQKLTADAVRETTDHTTAAIMSLVSELKQRPCIRDPNND